MFPYFLLFRVTLLTPRIQRNLILLSSSNQNQTQTHRGLCVSRRMWPRALGTWGPQRGRHGGALTAAAGSEGPRGEASRESCVNYRRGAGKERGPAGSPAETLAIPSVAGVPEPAHCALAGTQCGHSSAPGHTRARSVVGTARPPGGRRAHLQPGRQSGQPLAPRQLPARPVAVRVGGTLADGAGAPGPSGRTADTVTPLLPAGVPGRRAARINGPPVTMRF